MLMKLLIGVLIFALIWYYLLPLVPAPIHGLVVVVFVVAAIIYLIKMLGYELP